MSSEDDLSHLSFAELFREEANVQARVLSDGLLALERAPTDPGHLEACMRAAHSLKGAARIVALQTGVDVAHAMEDCFVRAQGGELVLGALHIDELLRGVDLLLRVGGEGDVQCAEVANFVDALERVVAGEPAPWQAAAVATNIALHAVEKVTPRVVALAADGEAPEPSQRSAGGRVVKNVTGYDLCKLIAGSWGTLAVLTEVSVKVLPRPPFTATLVLSGLDPARACAAMARACASPAPITGATHLNIHDGRPATLLRLEGFEPSVRVRIDALRALLADFDKAELLEGGDSLGLWREIGEVTPLGPLTSPLWRVSIPAAEAPALVSGLAPETWMMDWAGGLVWVVAKEPPRLPGRDGHVQYWGGAPAGAKPDAASRLSPAALRISQGLKAAFDPTDVFNRGRLLPPLGAG